jgi:hypothetical protein
MQSFRKKIKTLFKVGIDPLEEGVINFKNYNKEVDDLAKERLQYCDCLVDEPISFLKVIDERIPKLSGKMCDECGCTASYKFRQSISKCDKWQK